VTSIAATAFLGALLLHAWVGVRDVILDYVHPVGLRVAALAVLGSGLMAMAVWAVRMLLITRL
jgi:succinate dehydrogenase / fumarate reductase membrane anchor subunit